MILYKIKSEDKILINQYDIKNLCKNFYYKSKEKELFEKDCYFVIMNWIKRNFKHNILLDIEMDNILKKNIKHYRLDLIIDLMFHKSKKHKTGEVPIAKMFRYFIKQLKNNDEFVSLLNTINDKKLKMQVNQFPKPKVFRELYKSWYLLWIKIKYLKNLKRQGKLSNLDLLNNLKEDKKILGQYIAYKETKSKNLEDYYNIHIDIIEHYKLKDKDFKPKIIEDFIEKSKKEIDF